MATNLQWQTPGDTPFNLQTSDPTSGVITSHIYDDAMPDIKLVDYPLARQDGFKQVSSYWGQKLLPIDGVIKSITASGLEGKIDEFKNNLYPQAVGFLTVGRLTGDRLYKAFVKSVSITRDSFETTRAPFTAEFVVEGGFGQEPTVYASTVFSGVTSNNFTFNINVSGTAPFKPDIQFKVQAASQFGNLVVKNQTTNDIIAVARTYAVNDVLDINTASSSVTVAGSGITYSGVMPRFLAVSGTNQINVITQSGTATFDVSVVYLPQWL